MLTKLEEVTQAALRHIVSGDVLDEMLRQITRLLDSDTSAILLLDEEGKFLTVRAALGFDREIELAVPIPFGEGMAGRVAASAKPVVIRDLAEVELASPHLRERGIKSLVAIPIMVGEQVIGVAHAGSVETAAVRRGRHEAAPPDGRSHRARDHAVPGLRGRAPGARTRPSSRTAASPSWPRRARCSRPRSTMSRRCGRSRGSPCPIWPTGASWTSPSRSSRLERIAVAHIDPDKVALVAELERRWPAAGDRSDGPYAVLRSGTPELAPAIPEEMLARTARDDEHLAVIRDLGYPLVHVRADVGAGPSSRRAHLRHRRVGAQLHGGRPRARGGAGAAGGGRGRERDALPAGRGPRAGRAGAGRGR